jgi:tRNA-specific adenosine deaminase 3
LHLRNHAERGRGVFATYAIPAGTLLEESPVLLLTKEEWEGKKLNETIFDEYGFCWSNGGMAIGLGLGTSSRKYGLMEGVLMAASLFNHSRTPNVNFIRNTTANTISFRTVKRVEPGEELCICYSADESKLWFVDSSAPILPNGHVNRKLSEGSLQEFTFPEVDPEDLFDAQATSARQERREVRIRNQTKVVECRIPPSPTPSSPNESPPSALGPTQQPTPPASVIHSPQPVRYAPSRTLAPVDLSKADQSLLPPPLHSTPTRSPNTPPDLGAAVIVPELDWRAEDWIGKDLEDVGEEAMECVRIKGPVELDRLGDTGLSECRRVWAGFVRVADKQSRSGLSMSMSHTS